MKKFLLTFVTAAALALQWASNVRAMDIEARPPFVILSGPVTGTELRQLKEVIDSNPAITTVVLKNFGGGDARTGFLVGEYIRDKGLNTAASGFCRSSCSRMFLGGNMRSFSNDPLLMPPTSPFTATTATTANAFTLPHPS